MHEYHMIERAVQQAIAAAQKSNAMRITKIRIVVGECSGLAPEIISAHFAQAAKGTIAEGAELAIRPVGAYSGQNGHEFYIEDIEVEA